MSIKCKSGKSQGENEREVTAQSLTFKNIQPGQTFTHQIQVFADEILS